MSASFCLPSHVASRKRETHQREGSGKALWPSVRGGARGQAQGKVWDNFSASVHSRSRYSSVDKRIPVGCCNDIEMLLRELCKTKRALISLRRSLQRLKRG